MATSVCRWELNIEECKDSSFFRINLEISLTLHVITFILSTILLLYRRTKCNAVLWNGQCFSALDGFLFWGDVWCIGRILFISIQLTNLSEDGITLRYILFEIMAFPPVIAVATYTSGLFYAIPRMNFHRRTLQGSDSKFFKKLYLPHPNIVSYLYWIFVLLFFVLTFVPLMISVAAKKAGNHKLEDICLSFQLLMYPFAYGTLTVILVYYGRMLVHLAKESISLSINEFEKQKFKKFAEKMRILYVTLIFVFSWYILGIGTITFFRAQISSNEIANKTFAVLTEISSIVAALVITCALLYSEITTPRNTTEASTMWSTNQSDGRKNVNNDNFLSDDMETTVVNTRTSWYIGGTRVQPPLPSVQRSLTIKVDDDFGRGANVGRNFTESQSGFNYIVG